MTDLSKLGHLVLDRIPRLAPSAGALFYADVRVVSSTKQDLQLKGGKVAGHLESETLGYGLRVLVNGFWGFSSHHLWDERLIDETIAQAYALARLAERAAGGAISRRAELASRPSHRASWKSPCGRDPFAVDLKDKWGQLRDWDRRLRHIKGVTDAVCSMAFRRDHKLFLSTEGSCIDQELIYSGMGYTAYAASSDDFQVRSFPNSMGGQFNLKGYELLDDFAFAEETERVGEEAVALLSAPLCPVGKRDIILDSSQLGLQIHESCGHPVELDRVLGWEANYAGRSFLTPELLGNFTYGSPFVSITADSTSPGGLGTFAYDDEGSPATRWRIVDQGKFVGYLTSRETAPVVGEEQSRATMRADSWNRTPLIRMVNVSLEPGEWTLDDLFADTEGGLYFETNRSWSIDQLRYNFQFGTEVAWEIRNGRKGQLFKNPTYQGITPDFWRSCDAVCDSSHWTLWGVANCGKGEPGQLMGTAHGASPARFRQVSVGVHSSSSR